MITSHTNEMTEKFGVSDSGKQLYAEVEREALIVVKPKRLRRVQCAAHHRGSQGPENIGRHHPLAVWYSVTYFFVPAIATIAMTTTTNAQTTTGVKINSSDDRVSPVKLVVTT